jgi:TRAP-type C4-dicarboxylate transport system substrate-binding protein
MILIRCALIAFVLTVVNGVAKSEPLKLRLAYFTSDRTLTYSATVKPFVDAVNAEAADLLAIEVGFSGAFGKNPIQQLQLVLDGQADMAFIVPGYTPERFPDNSLIELPGLFRNIREATLVYTRLVASGALRGYEDLLVIGAFATEPESIHTRSGAASLDELKGKRIRANNPVQGAGLEALGMLPMQMPINQVSMAIGAGKIDGATASPAPLVEFGISRVAAHHYLLGVAAAPLAVIMKKEKFESLPKRGQDIIRKFSGEWTAERYIAAYTEANRNTIEQFTADPDRKVVFPSQSDQRRARAAFAAVTHKWLDTFPGNRDLLAKAEEELATIRSGLVTGQR